LRAFVFRKKKTITEPQNKYIAEHKKKLMDDEEYQEYLEWCEIKGEIPAEKEGFDKHRMQEYHLYKKLLKHGIGGLNK